MKTKLLHLTKSGLVEEYDWTVPELRSNQIRVKSILTGLCRSDIGNFRGDELMPYSDKENPHGKVGTWGHESLAEVLEIGTEINDVKPGDFIAGFGDPAYSYFWNANKNEYVKVPEVDSRFILQPVASGVNIWLETYKMMKLLDLVNEKVLVLGTGFLSMVIAKALTANGLHMDVVGRANQDFWSQSGFKQFRSVDEVTGQYKVIIDLSSKPGNFDVIVDRLSKVEGLVCYAATPTSPVTTNFFNACWRCLTFILPSPRNSGFIDAMRYSKKWIEDGTIDVSDQWTKGYARSTEFRQAFEDGANRKPGYVRGYLDFRK